MNATDCQQAAIDRAKTIDPTLVRISRVRPGLYSCLGQSNWYEIEVSSAGYRCNCTAGQHGKPCWHVADTYRYRLAERARKALTTAVATSATVKALTSGQQAKKDLWG